MWPTFRWCSCICCIHSTVKMMFLKYLTPKSAIFYFIKAPSGGGGITFLFLQIEFLWTAAWYTRKMQCKLGEWWGTSVESMPQLQKSSNTSQDKIIFEEKICSLLAIVVPLISQSGLLDQLWMFYTKNGVICAFKCLQLNIYCEKQRDVNVILGCESWVTFLKSR